MRISDWSSDVCSSDLSQARRRKTMTVPTGTFSTFAQVGIREDLSDVIYDISPADTTFLNLARHVDVENTLFEWQTDALAAAATTEIGRASCREGVCQYV